MVDCKKIERNENMLPESQNTEYKESWRDEYLKWICGFANAQGGRICLGVNDAREVVGLEEKEAHKLTEDIPNKVRDVLGIIVDVNLMEENGLWYVEIVVPAYSNPINYKGQYHYRSGSTKQEMKGAALNKFLLERTGLKWDEYVVADAKVEDLSPEAFARFRKEAAENHRVDEGVLHDSDEELLKNLRLVEARTGQLQRGALLLFHPDPERFVTGAFVKLGFFAGDDDELVFQDEVHGPLMLQVDKVMSLMKERYLIYAISYEGTHRRESLQYPEDALRESMLNALVHKDYSSGTPIQISVYPDHIVFYNSGRLPEQWTVAHLFEKHSSEPFNTALANAFFRCGDIESWGRGYRKIVRAMEAVGLLPPRIEVMGGMAVTLYNNPVAQMQAMGLDERQQRVMMHVLKHGVVTNSDVQQLLTTSKPTATRVLKSLEGHLEQVGTRGAGTFYRLKRL